MNARANTDYLRKFVEERLGLPLFGVAPIGSVIETASDEIIDVAREMSFAIALGHPLSKAILDTIIDRPTRIYKHHYQQVNWRLDRLALELAIEIERTGARALPTPASVIVDWEKQTSHLSHRHAALGAGLGWRGRHGLVVTPEFGAQVRWSTVLTDMPLIPGIPMDRDCGDCTACIETCPAEAIEMDGCNVGKCFEKLKEFAKIPGVGQYICGVCIKVCRGER